MNGECRFCGENNQKANTEKTLSQWIDSSFSLRARTKKKLGKELPQKWIGGIKIWPKVSGNQGLSKS